MRNSQTALFAKRKHMTIEEIQKALAHKDRKFPREALEQAVAQKDEITPHLLKILEKVADDPDDILDQDNFSFLYAIFLLAQFRETRTYPLIVRIASLPPMTVGDLLGDTITEGLPRILASVCGGDTSLIKQLAENTRAYEFVRSSAFIALTVLVASGDESRDEVMSYYSDLFDAKLKEEPSEEVVKVLTDLVNCANYLYPEELYDRIKKAFEEDLIDERSIDLEWVNKTMAEGKEAALAELRKDKHFRLVENAIEEMEWWAWYSESDDEDDDEDDEDLDLSVEEIMEALAQNGQGFPRLALRQAVAKREEITPLLLESLERAANNPEKVLDEEDDSFVYAMYLLAQFREKRAYPLIVKLVSHPPELVDDLIGGVSTEDLHNILASVSNGDTSLITGLVANKEIEEFVRAAAIRSWLTLVVSGARSRDEAIAYYKSLFEGGLEDRSDVVWSELADCATDLYPEELYGQIKKAFNDGLVDEFFIDLEWVDARMALGRELVLAQLPENHHLIDDAAFEVEWWASDWDFDEDWEEDEDWDEDQDDPDTNHMLLAASNGNYFAPPPYPAPGKIGRNELCPCGSGKKYKECCGA